MPPSIRFQFKAFIDKMIIVRGCQRLKSTVDFLISADLPGVEKSDIKVSLENEILTV